MSRAIRRTVGGALRDTAERLHSTALHLLRDLRREDEASGVGPAQLSALSVLVFAGSRTLGELAAAEQVAPPTMTRIAAGLEESGLLSRRRDTSDRRVVHVRATARGRRVLLAARNRRLTRLEDRLAVLSVSDLRTLDRAGTILRRLERG
ncbi:MAG: MarR family transcriptional regulator [Planctomycetota bacterium]